MLAMIVGGIGLFLLGMMLMTDGLRSLAGDALRSILERSVRGPITGLAWGAGITALVQSSSATTLMTIGFVSAGLLSFSQSLGVIFGANVGTTSTGWIVSTVGLNFSVSAVALPVVGIGALLRLIGGGRVSPLGTALAGFGLLFVGIDVLQSGMETLASRIDPASFPGMTVIGLPMLVVIGAVMTVVMQSSSAAVATTLAALHAHAITLDQAAVLVIGQNVGTSVKAVLASIGASIPAKRTAVAHILFNVVTAAIALAMLPVFLRAARWYAGDGAEGEAVGLAAFHTGFNIVGVLVLLPMTARFASAVQRLVPEPTPTLTRNLDPSVFAVPSVAIEAVRRTLIDLAQHAADVLGSLLRPRMTGDALNRRIAELDEALAQTQTFLSRLAAEASTGPVFDRQLSAIHASDHIGRLLRVLRDRAQVDVVEGNEELRRLATMLVAELADALADIDSDEPGLRLGEASQRIATARRAARARLLEQTASGKLSPGAGERLLGAFMWLDAIAYHFYRAVHHLGRRPEPVASETSDDR